MRFLAAVLVEQKKPLVLEEIEVPAVGEGQVLVKVLCSGICGSQIGEIDGVKGPDRFLPHLLGHEGCGEVLECGAGVTTVKAGDRVVLHWMKGAGQESAPPKYSSPTLGVINAGWVTTFNEYAVVSENRMTVVPSDFDPEAAALMGCAVLTGFGVVANNAKLKKGESLVLFGAGGVGMNVLQAAVMAGASEIVVIDINDEKLAMAKTLGATHVVNATQGDVETAIKDAVGDGVDVAVDTTGNPRVIETAYEITAAQGRTILVGVPRKGEKVSIYTLPLHFGKVLTGSHGGEARPEQDVPAYADLVQSGALDLNQLVGQRYALENINDAIQDMRDGRAVGRCLVKMGGERGK